MFSFCLRKSSVCVCWTLLFSVLTGLFGCESAPVELTATTQQLVAFDPSRKAAVLVEGAALLPCPHPEKPQVTLQPALYCDVCQVWYPTPPLLELNRTGNGGRCPKSGTPLQMTGPLPEVVLRVPTGSEASFE